MKYKAALTHIDTCLPCYLLDHCNRDNEMLLGVAVSGNTTNEEVKEALLQELHARDFHVEVEYDACRKAIEEEFYPPESMGRLFDSTLDTPMQGDTDEHVYAYFRLSWEAE